MQNKLVFCFIILSILFSCSSQKNVNRVIVDPNINKEILIGKVNEVGLKNYKVFKDADIYYKNYKVDEQLIEKIAELSKDITITVVFGSWCGDSKSNVPIFKKIVDKSGFDTSKVEYIAVDRKKSGGDIDISELKVEYVPTFIFYRKYKEIGRIIEYPKGKNIEEDWIYIVSK